MEGGWGKGAGRERKDYLGAGTPFLWRKRREKVFVSIASFMVDGKGLLDQLPHGS